MRKTGIFRTVPLGRAGPGSVKKDLRGSRENRFVEDECGDSAALVTAMSVPEGDLWIGDRGVDFSFSLVVVVSLDARAAMIERAMSGDILG